MSVCTRSNGQHLVWRAGNTMSPADFCHIAGNTNDRPCDCIIISHTRQTLAQFEASARTEARLRKPCPASAELITRAAEGGSSSIWVPESGNFVTVFIPPVLPDCASSSSPVFAVSGKEPHSLESEEPQHNEITADAWEQLLLKDVVSGMDLERGGGLAKGILVSRSSDGWYKVLLVEVILVRYS